MEASQRHAMREKRRKREPDRQTDMEGNLNKLEHAKETETDFPFCQEGDLRCLFGEREFEFRIEGVITLTFVIDSWNLNKKKSESLASHKILGVDLRYFDVDGC